MPTYEINRDGFFYSGDGGEPVCLISFWNYYLNFGAIPLHAYYPGERLLSDIFRKLQELYGEPACALAAAALFRQSLLGYRPLRVLAVCENPALINILAVAARETHPESRVYTLAEDGDYLRDSFFDLAVISGNEPSAEAMRNIIRATRVGGCVARVAGERLEEKRISEADHAAPLGLEDEMRGLRAKLMRLLGTADITSEGLCVAIAVISEMERLAVRMFDISDINLKQRINELKDNALNALYATDGAFRSEQLEKLIKHLLSAPEYTGNKNSSGGGL